MPLIVLPSVGPTVVHADPRPRGAPWPPAVASSLSLIKGSVIQKQGNKSGLIDLEALSSPQVHSEPRYVRRWFLTAGWLQSATAGTRPFRQEIEKGVFFFQLITSEARGTFFSKGCKTSPHAMHTQLPDWQHGANIQYVDTWLIVWGI